jgi:tRNA-2-methylthio-N6-dimethylallyladenosine synthase
VLAAMKRGYTALEYKAIVRRLRERRPDLSLTSDFIVGFPGESDADHAATMKLIDDVGFDGAFSFAYSARPGTPAAELADAVPPDVAQPANASTAAATAAAATEAARAPVRAAAAAPVARFSESGDRGMASSKRGCLDRAGDCGGTSAVELRSRRRNCARPPVHPATSSPRSECGYARVMATST